MNSIFDPLDWLLRLWIHLFLKLLDEFWDKEREDEEAYGEGDFKRDQLSPVTAGPNFLEGPDEKGEDEGSHKDSQSGTKKIVPETDLG